MTGRPTAAPGQGVAAPPISAYTLTPAELQRSTQLYHLGLGLDFGSLLVTLVVLGVLVRWRVGARLARLAQRWTRYRLGQAFILIPALLLTLDLVTLPLRLVGHHLGLAYGLSVQGWASWFVDWGKTELLTLVFATLVLAGVYELMRRWPQHWWFAAWLACLPIILATVFLAPLVLDPLFNHFEPLAQTQPALARQLGALARFAGLDIPDSRILLMRASDKLTTYNAYVTGWGASQRIVVWDTTTRDLTTPQTLSIFGHELGHSVLRHLWLGMAFSAMLTLAGCWLLYALGGWLVRLHGARLAIASLAHWSSLPLLLLLATVLGFFGEPLANGFSRWEEHAADVYGLQITRAYAQQLPAPERYDAGQAAAQSLQRLGEKSYSYPTPARWLVFWSYTHPPIATRIRFILDSCQP